MTSGKSNPYSRLGLRRGFALPIVLLLTTVGVITVSAMLTRYGSQNRFVHRHLDRYVEHHTQRGVQEIVGTWLETARGEAIGELIREDGLAFVVEFEGGRRMELFMRDGQGTLLVNPAEVTDRERRVTEAAMLELQQSMPPERFLAMTRSAGPAPVSVASADEEVLRAVLIGAGVEDSSAERIVGDLLLERNRGSLGRQDIMRVLSSPSVTGESRGAASVMLTGTATLWMIEARVYDRPRGEVTARYQGLVEVEATSRGRNAQSRFKPSGPFLTWEVLEGN